MDIMRKIRYRDLSINDDSVRNRILQRVDAVLQHGQILLGPELDEFERLVARYCNMKYCVGVGSGTDALCVALKSLNIGPGDEVITTPLSWIATLHAIHYVGAIPIFVDVKDDLNLNENLIEAKITRRTKAIIPVHFTGRICNMHMINRIAKRHGLLVVEDAAQAFGATQNGVKAGALGDVGCYSMNPMKVFPAYGEAGAVVTNNKDVYEWAIKYRYLGTIDRDVCVRPSLNWKIDTIQAAIMLETFGFVENNIARRIELAKEYDRRLKLQVICPVINNTQADRSVFFDYVIQVDRRDELKDYLCRSGIEARVKHPILMPDQPAYDFLKRCELPKARSLVRRILSLPLHEKMSVDDIEYVSNKIKEFQT